MTDENAPEAADDGRVVPFRKGAPRPTPRPPSPVDDLTKYAKPAPEADDYRHRMIVNAAAAVFVAALIGAAIWLADTMAEMRRNQDCVLSGRRGCTPVEVNRE